MQSYLKDLENSLETYFLHKAPKMPQEIQDLIVKFGPWLLLLMLIISVVGLLSAFISGTFIMPFAYAAGQTVGLMFTVSWVLSIVILVIDALALPGLFRRDIKAWRLLFLGTLIAIVQYVVSLNILGLIIASAISFYILFQIKHNYR